MTDSQDHAPSGEEEQGGKASVWAVFKEFTNELWTSGTFRLFPMLFLYIAGFGIILPFIPNLMTDFFASMEAGKETHCEAEVPKSDICIDASNTVVLWTSVTGFLTNTVLLFLLSPMTGVWSDIWGRKPFIIVGQLLSLLPKFVLWMHLSFGLTLYLYYPLDVFNGAISPVVASLAYVADVLAPKYRGAGFGLLLGTFAAGIAVTPKIGYRLGMENAIIWGVWLKIAGIVYTFVFMPESMTREARELARQQLAEKRLASPTLYPTPAERAKYSCAAMAPLVYAARVFLNLTAVKSIVQGFGILLRYPQFIKLTLCLMISGLVANGLSDIDSQYFILLFNFEPTDFSNLYLIFGGGTLIVQVLLMQPVLSLFGERGCLIIAFLAAVGKGVILAAARTKTDVYLALVVGTIGVMSFPSIASIKANNVGAHEQGAVQGALSGAQALSQGVGPLVFMRLFHIFTQHEYGIAYMPRAVPLIAAAICIVPVILVATINMQKLTIRSQERAMEGLEEPLLPRDAAFEGGCCAGGAPHPLTGHEVLAEEAVFAHKEGDVTQGLLLEGDLYHAQRKQHKHSACGAAGHTSAEQSVTPAASGEGASHQGRPQ